MIIALLAQWARWKSIRMVANLTFDSGIGVSKNSVANRLTAVQYWNSGCQIKPQIFTIEPDKTNYAIRMRVDGVLQENVIQEKKPIGRSALVGFTRLKADVRVCIFLKNDVPARWRTKQHVRLMAAIEWCGFYYAIQHGEWSVGMRLLGLSLLGWLTFRSNSVSH